MLDVMAAQLDSTCKLLEQQYGTGKVQGLLCDVTDSKKLVGLIIDDLRFDGRTLMLLAASAGLEQKIVHFLTLQTLLNSTVIRLVIFCLTIFCGEVGQEFITKSIERSMP